MQCHASRLIWQEKKAGMEGGLLQIDLNLGSDCCETYEWIEETTALSVESHV